MKILRVFWIVFLFLIYTTTGWAQKIVQYPNTPDNPIIKNVNQIRYNYPDSAIAILEARFEEVIKSDTVLAVELLLIKANISGNKAEYFDSYDAFWKGLLLADEIGDERLRSTIYKKLGRFYGYSGRKIQSFEYLNKALEIDKKLVEKGVIQKPALTVDYYLLASNYREADDFPNQIKYIDSCFYVYSEQNIHVDAHYVQFEKAIYFSNTADFQQSLELFESIHPWFVQNDPSYLVLIYKYWGDLFFSNKQYVKAEQYYKKSIAQSDQFNSHKDFTPLVYEGLTRIYVATNNYQKAFESQKTVKELDALYFDSRSKNNQSLLEIKDLFRVEKEKREKQLRIQQLKQLEQEEEINTLQRLLLLVALTFVTLMTFFYFKYLKTKHKAEKELIRKTKELELKKAQELLDIKNKELTASTLQLIEKDEFLIDLKKRVKNKDGSIETNEVKKVLKSISYKNNSWEEFNLRFVKINSEFYDNLLAKHSKLTQGDQKICALIKLNFSSKDMANLLGISVESVHTTRYRLRKKMNLDRSVKLEEYINSF